MVHRWRVGGSGLSADPVRVVRSPAATQALADIFAGDIAAHPTDWHMLQPFWLTDREGADVDVTKDIDVDQRRAS